jgi:hypothetical protein
VDLLSNYPPAVVARAVEPVNGIAGNVSYLNFASVKKHLDQWADEHWSDVKRRSPKPRLAEPPENPEMKARISRMFAELQAEMRRGQSTRPPVNEVGLATLKKQIDKGLSPSTAPDAAMTLEAAVEHYKTHDLAFKPKQGRD